MTRNLILANRIREVFLNGYWIANTNYKDQLQNLDWKTAVHKVNRLNTIAALTYHVNYYLAGLLTAFDTNQLSISDKFSFDLPSIENDETWKRLVSEFLMNAEKFASYIEQIDDDRLDEPFVEKKYGSTLRNVEAIIEHSYYHLGQISLIRKLIQ